MKSKLKILVVDDEAPMRMAIEQVLTAEGYEVRTATNGESAVEIATREHFDLILTDLIMPRMDGIEVILALTVSQPGTPIIAMSGAANGGARCYLSLASKIGACQTLSKPFDRPTLLRAIEWEINKRAVISA